MAKSIYKPFGTVITKTPTTVDFSVDSGFNYKNSHSEGIMDIFNSAVGDFTERPLQIMIREIAKNLLIFTPIGWIVLLYIIGRKYKGKLSYAGKNFSAAICDVINSLSGPKQVLKQPIEQPSEHNELDAIEQEPIADSEIDSDLETEMEPISEN